MAPRCGGYPSKDDCDDGDMVLFGGLLCASGDGRGCALVRDAQGGDGRWWRSPRRNPGNLGRRNSFSRDMSLGVALYLATTGDREAARRWLTWIEDHRPCVTKSPTGNGCLIYGPHRFCTDDEDQRCAISPVNWGVLGKVFTALSLPLNQEMRLNRGTDVETLPLRVRQAPLGYELHLPAVEVLLKARLSDDSGPTEQAARALAERQPDNPFFAFLRDGPSDALAARLIELCPRPSDVGRRHQWSWERDTASQAWKDSMGWDCIFLANFTGP